MKKSVYLLDAGDAAHFLRVSLPTLYRYIHRHGLRPHIRVGREMFFRVDRVRKWLARQQAELKKWPLKIQAEGR